jgi:hypothetical protein
MKNLAKSLIVVSSLVTVVATESASAGLCKGFNGFDDFRPILGLDYYQAWRRIKGNLHPILPTSFPGITVYVGGKFSDYFGVELGLDISKQKSKTWVFPNGTAIGAIRTSGTISGTTSISYWGAHFDVIGYLPLYPCVESTELFAAIGYGNASGLRLGIGANYLVTYNFGLRAKFGYENRTTVLGGSPSTIFGISNPYRYATTLSVGAFYRF